MQQISQLLRGISKRIARGINVALSPRHSAVQVLPQGLPSRTTIDPGLAPTLVKTNTYAQEKH